MTALSLALLGGVVAWDGTSVGQVMLSRPIVAATLAGLVLGVTPDGFLVGAVLEVYLLVSFPVGGGRFPEGGPAAVVAASVIATAPGPGGLALAVAFALVWGQLGSVTVSAMRNANVRWATHDADAVAPEDVRRGHATGLIVDFVRGFVVTLSGVLAATLAPELAVGWPLDESSTRALLLVGGTVSLGILARSFGGLRRRGALLVTGLLVGLAGGVFL